MSKKIPDFKTDDELAAFLEQDLTDYITPESFKPARFAFLP
jgi:predicted DNA binding CopG/RHH family protein